MKVAANMLTKDLMAGLIFRAQREEDGEGRQEIQQYIFVFWKEKKRKKKRNSLAQIKRIYIYKVNYHLGS